MHATWPNEIESFVALGSIARRQGRWEESRTYYEKAVARDPLRADLRSSLVGVLVATRDLAAALDAVDDALARWPEDVGFIAEKARILQASGGSTKRARCSSRCGRGPKGIVYRRIVSQAVLQRKYADAIGVLEGQLARKPDDQTSANLRLELGRLRSLAGDAIGAVHRPRTGPQLSGGRIPAPAEERERRSTPSHGPIAISAIAKGR